MIGLAKRRRPKGTVKSTEAATLFTGKNRLGKSWWRNRRARATQPANGTAANGCGGQSPYLSPARSAKRSIAQTDRASASAANVTSEAKRGNERSAYDSARFPHGRPSASEKAGLSLLAKRHSRQRYAQVRRSTPAEQSPWTIGNRPCPENRLMLRSPGRARLQAFEHPRCSRERQATRARRRANGIPSCATADPGTRTAPIRPATAGGLPTC